MPASNTETKLPTFNAGESLIDQLTETVMRSLVERIKQGTPVSGKGISVVQTAAGTIINLDNQRPPIGMYDNPYYLQNCLYASSTAGGGGTYGSLKNFGGTDGLTPWGGNGDSNSDHTLPSSVEIWHRDRPPLDAVDYTTQGVQAYVPTRYFLDSGGQFYTLYGRSWILDSRGNLLSIGPELPITYAPLVKVPMHPWQCYITALATNSCSVKINPNSTLMQTYDYRASWDLSTWKDAWTHANITNFTDTFVLTAATHCVWMEVVFVSGDISTVAIKNGAPGAFTWNADLRYVSANNRAAGSGSFTWYQLLAYFKPSASGDGGSEVDAVFSGVNYKLMCPTTTHLMQGYIAAVDSVYGAFGDPHFHIAIVPWHGCWFPTS